MKSKASILGILGIVFLIVAVSGCTNQNTANSKLLVDYNLTTTSVNPVIDKYVTLPNGTKSVTIEYSNLTSRNTNQGFFQFASYNVAKNTQATKNFTLNMIDIKSVITNSTPTSGNLTLDVNGAKSIGIRDSLGKGNVKVIITQ